ncbi:hypothetical protein Btru_057176 [Bulinus truncatus]|nr:hypothetical protein Btru_057176 [Bulinus truncatus]
MNQLANKQVAFSFLFKFSNLSIGFYDWKMLTKSATVSTVLVILTVTTAVICQESATVRDETVRLCGARSPNGNTIDLTEPDKPGPFHDLTKEELKRLRTFLENHPDIKAAKFNSDYFNSSSIFVADLYLPPKTDTLSFLDQQGPQPPRRARVIMFRGDLKVPVVEEYVCGPLPDLKYCNLIDVPGRRNPIEFSVRPSNNIEYQTIMEYLTIPLEKQIRHILLESYGATICKQDGETCLKMSESMVGTGILGDINKRKKWLFGMYNLPYFSLHPVDFGVLYNLEGADPSQWSVEKVWYAGNIYDSVDELVEGYNSGRIPKLKMTKPSMNDTDFYSLHRRSDPVPDIPQRPPLQVEPDGKRYSLKEKQVKYLDWTFNFRMSALNGPTIYDVRFKGERIVYEMGLSEISVFYSGSAPLSQISNYVDSSYFLGSNSRSLIPGGDCPEYSTLVNQTFWSQNTGEPSAFDATFCLFEHNNGYPLRRHSSYSRGVMSFYGGLLDTALTLRSALTVSNYDYIIDFIFHHNGIIETRLMSTGYIQTSFYNEREKPYGFHVENFITGSLHYHMAQFKVDLDVGGTSNRFETLNIVNDKVPLRQDPSVTYHQMKFEPHLKKTEMEAVYDYDFRSPKYLLVHNDKKKTQQGEISAYRVQMNGMSYNILPKDMGNERSVSWARHQMVVTKHKDAEFWSSSVYAALDGQDPVVNFTQFYADDENIVDEDLVLWLTGGMYHIPHTEDLPVTPTVGNHLTFFLLPYNYFKECPSMGSRDAIHIQHVDPLDHKKGVTVDRNGNSRDQCVLPKSTLEEILEENPDLALETNRETFI